MEAAKASDKMVSTSDPKWTEDFNKALGTAKAASAITDEDLAFERSLQAAQNDTPPIFNEGASENRLTTERVEHELLGEHVDGYRPASTLSELRDQCFHAKQLGCNSVEATPDIIRYFTKPHYPDDVGYFMYDSIRVWIPGFWATHAHFDKMSVEARQAESRKLLGLK